MDYDTVINFAKDVDVLTIEIENVNVDALEDLEAQGKAVYPSAETLKQIRDKGIQKAFYQAHDIPTSPFDCFENKAELLKAFEEAKMDITMCLEKPNRRL